MKSRDEIRADALIEIDSLLTRYGSDQHVLICYGVLDAGLLSLAKSQGTIKTTEFLYQTADLWAASVDPDNRPLERLLERPPKLEMTRWRRMQVWCFRRQMLIGCIYGCLIGGCLVAGLMGGNVTALGVAVGAIWARLGR